MYNKYLIFLAGAALLLAGCSREPERSSGETDGGIPVRFGLDLGGAFAGGTGYEPMGRAEEEDPYPVKVVVKNGYKCFITKEINGNWYVEDIFEARLRAEEGLFAFLDVTEDFAPEDLYLELRPGHYKMLMIVNPTIEAEKALAPGDLVLSAGQSPDELPGVNLYNNIENSYGVPGGRYIANELFAGLIEFTLEKSDGLSSTSQNPMRQTVELTRRVSSLRFLLKEAEPSVDPNFTSPSNLAPFVMFNMNREDGGEFCAGLNIWGEPYYNGLTTIKTGYFNNARTYLIDGTGYQVPSTCRNSERLYGHYYFIDPEDDAVGVTVSDVVITIASRSPEFEVWTNNPGDTFSHTMYLNRASNYVIYPAGQFIDDLQFVARLVEDTETGKPIDFHDLFPPNGLWNLSAYQIKY